MSLLGLDVGTTGTKGVVFDLDGRVLASSYREYPLYSPQPGWQELDSNQVWECVREILAETAAATRNDPIRAMSISCQGEACTPVSRDGSVLANAPATFDARTADMPAWWTERMSPFDITRISGMPVHGMYTLCKMMWFKKRRPEVYKQAWKFLCFEDFVHLKLGLDPVISYPLAARTMAFDVHRGDWSEELLAIAEVDRELFARPKPSGSMVGVIPDTVADDIGLPRGIVVAAGGHDQPAGALGAGVLESGEAMYATGTVECICSVFDSFQLTQETVDGNVCCYPSCIQGLYASLGFNFTGGSLLKWYRDTFAGPELEEARATGRDVYEILCERVPKEPEHLIVLPHFTMTGTPHFDTQARGAILGLTLNTPREEIVSAILSGVTYEMKLNLELLHNAGVKIERLRAIGGGAKSTVWLQRKADIMGVPIAVLETSEAASLGVAMLAGKAAGIVKDIADMARQVVRVKRVCEPDAKRSARYAEMFAVYRSLYPALKNINHALAALDGQV
jgi:xylulokinase